MNKEQTKVYIAALLNEREGYEKYGNQDGVDAVNAELDRVGYKASTPAKRAVKLTPKKADAKL